jgi:hypothetical protein
VLAKRANIDFFAGIQDDGEQMTLADMRLAARRRNHAAVSTRLAAMTDHELDALVPEAGTWLEHFHGGQSGVIQVEGARVFVKKIALTALERAAGDTTANMFNLPLFYQYGVGSAGFGARRELIAYERASEWALSGNCRSFPIVHHTRVLPRPRPNLSARQKAWLDEAPARWAGSDAVRVRVASIAAATESIVVFMECAPKMLSTWLVEELALGGFTAELEQKVLGFHEELTAATMFMNDRGMLHFDLHQGNVLTDGEQLYIADFGLALCRDFDLTEEDRAFYDDHRLYDCAYVAQAVREWIAPRDSAPALTPALEALVERLEPPWKVMSKFLYRVSVKDKRTPYPAREVAIAVALAKETGLQPRARPSKLPDRL